MDSKHGVKIVNASLLAGVSLASAGVGVGWGLGPGLLAAGLLVLLLTVYKLERTRR